MKSLWKILLFLIFSGFSTLNAQVIAGWDFDPLPGGSNNYGPSPYAAITIGSNVTIGGLTRGSGVGTTGTGAGNAWGGNNFTETSLANAITANDFATFTIQANTGYKVSLSSIGAYNIRRSSTGPTTGQWQYRIGSGSFVNIGSSITWGGVTNSAGNPQSAISLSGISDLQNVAAPTTITIRVVTWGASGATGTWYLNDPSATPGDDFIVNGAVALPIDLLSFEVEKQANSTRLTFTTALEQNNSHFQIERSPNGAQFEEIGRIPGAGNSSTILEYTFTDEKPLQGVNYYRLKQVDFDGQFSYSPVVTVQFGETTARLRVAPSPASDEVTVRFETAADEALQLGSVRPVGPPGALGQRRGRSGAVRVQRGHAHRRVLRAEGGQRPRSDERAIPEKMTQKFLCAGDIVFLL